MTCVRDLGRDRRRQRPFHLFAMRPLLFDPKTPDVLRDQAVPPNEVRGSISRLALADITGLPRETVRRKVNNLIDLGLAEEDEHGHVRPARKPADPRWQSIADQGFAAVQRYDQKLRSLGCRGIGDERQMGASGRPNPLPPAG